MKPITYIALGSFLLMVGCSSTNYSTTLDELPKDQGVKVITKNGAEFYFQKWSISSDSTFIGVENSTAQYIPRDSIQAIHKYYGAKPITSYVLPILLVGVSILFFLGLYSLYTTASKAA